MSDAMQRIIQDDFALADGAEMHRRALEVLRFWRVHGRLPWLVATEVREVHEMLGEIVAGLDAKMKEVA